MLPIDLQLLKYFFFEKPIFHYKIKPYFELNAYKDLNQALLTYQNDPTVTTRKLHDITFTIFDLETTGLIPEIGHEIISIGAVKMKGLEHCQTETFYQIVRPIRPVSKRISALTRLEKDEVKQGDPFIEVFQHFLAFSQDSILVAHPAKFDMRFLQTMLKRWKLPSYQPYAIDSQLMAKWLLPSVDCQLDPLIRHFNIDQLERHHALNDAKMTAELFRQLLKQTFSYHIQTFEELETELQVIKQKKSPRIINH